jgi:ATP-binding cassette subfamily B protein
VDVSKRAGGNVRRSRKETGNQVTGKPSILANVARLWRLLSVRRRGQFYVILVLMVAASFAEIFSLGLIVPFLAVVTAPDKILNNAFASGLLSLLGVHDQSQVVLWMALAFCTATLVAAGIRLLLLYASTGFSFALGADLSLQIYRRTLYQPYPVHVGRNSTDVINGVIWKANEVTINVLVQLLTLASAAFLAIGILTALLFISASVTLAAMAAFAVIYGGVIWFTRRQIRRDSATVAEESPKVLKALQEGLGGIRDVLIDGTQETFTDIYRIADRKMRAAQGRLVLTSGSPRFVVEGLGMVFIAILAVSVSRAGSTGDAIPVLGALALGAQRLLPVVQQAYAAMVMVRGSESSLSDVLELLGQPLPEASAQAAPRLPFTRKLTLEVVRFAYTHEGQTVLDGINLTIRKGARVGIFGPTGGGKSTLLDILMGLLEPSEGVMRVDGVAVDTGNRRGWQAHISHVPQSIYLSDASIAENIAFGIPAARIDMARVREAARAAQIAEAIESWPEAYNTFVGERGVRLSGGQRQRVGVARALYRQSDVIIFDEATSALDEATERDLMAAVEALSSDLTIVMVAHRMTTLRGCDTLIEVSNGVARSRTSEEVFGNGRQTAT